MRQSFFAHNFTHPKNHQPKTTMTILKPQVHLHSAHDLKSPLKPSKMSKIALTDGSMDFPYSDSHLQSPTSHRRYMRRGSKAPSMFLLSQPHFDDNKESESNLGLPPVSTLYPRRMSLVSLLAQELQDTEMLSTSTPVLPVLPQKRLNQQESSTNDPE